MNQNQFQFTLTSRDMAEAFSGARKRLWRRFLHWKTAAALGGFIALMIFAEFWAGGITTTPPPPSPASQPSSLKDIWLPLLPWIIIFGFVWVFLFRKLRGQSKNHRLIDRPHTLVVEEEKLTWIEPFSRLEYQWAAFFGFKETKNLFLLYLSDPKLGGVLMFHIVPQRAFGPPETIAEFRQVLETNIQSPVSRFPVVQREGSTTRL